MRYSYHEHLLTADDSPGTVYTRNLLGAQQTNQYFLKGAAGGETYSPVFTYQGFRYMEFVDLDDSVEIVKVEALVLSSDTERTGYYETSSGLINQLYSNSYWSQVGNFTSLPTDRRIKLRHQLKIMTVSIHIGRTADGNSLP